ncbi:hypothetical protein [Luteipulveratus halotolerans]|uniref:hypothetical protein n=1 Tax=Luteipulveratus halotolerans TaxID=1631356 RepID=UPI0012FAD8B6|nr:hypothetical protein [Luteipulveratus halotolerans]
MTSRAAFSLGVIGGSGGCGASVLTGAIATRAAKAGHRTVAVDLDPAGGGLDVVLGLEHAPGPRWRDLHGLRGALDSDALIDQLPTTADGLAVLSYDRAWFDADAAMQRTVIDGLRAGVDVVVLDRARHRAVPTAMDAAVLLAHGTLSGLAGAQVTADHLLSTSVEPWLITRDVADHVVHQVCEVLQTPLLAELRSESAVESDLARGVPPGRSHKSVLARVADTVLRDLLIERRAAA